MTQRPLRLAFTTAIAVTVAATLVDGCSASGSTRTAAGTSTGSGGASASSGATGGGQGGQGGIVLPPDAGSDAADATNPCGTACGPTELCDPAHTGLDDDCNGVVDQGCPCTKGQVHWCFKGDPSFHGVPGCHDGTETCNELGSWGPCIGGVHAIPPDNCYMNDTLACHAIVTAPFAGLHLATGTGQFSAGAVAGSETYAVQCPAGVSQCPGLVAPDYFTPIQSGEYTVTYTKSVAGASGPLSCTFPLFVGALGLRVELSWEHTTADNGTDLDLHVHQPKCQTDGDSCATDGDCCSAQCRGGVCGPLFCKGNGVACTPLDACCSGTCAGGTCAAVTSMPWGVSPAVPQDCMWNNCRAGDLVNPDPTTHAPHWFADANAVPQPVNWDDMANYQDNTCYNAPRGAGPQWEGVDKGCHNPRLDIDDYQCDASITDPQNTFFCAPENTNIDYPPDRQWMRIGVHYYWSQGQTYDVHPEVKVFCDGALSADLGPHGFYTPEAPVTFTAADGASMGGVGNRFWVVADVAFMSDGCGHRTCVVQPIHADTAQLTPYFILDTQATTSFDPAWPPPPP